MSLEQVVGLVIGGVAAVAAIYAAVEARRARLLSQRSEHSADRRWLVTTRPRPKVGFADPVQLMAADAGPSIRVTASNPGGAITSGLVIARFREALYVGGLTLPEQSGQAVSTLQRMAERCPARYWTGNMLSEILVVLAEDIDGRMWECQNGVITSRPMPSPGSDEFFGWLEDIRAKARSQQSKEARPSRVRRLLGRVLRRGGGPTIQ